MAALACPYSIENTGIIQIVPSYLYLFENTEINMNPCQFQGCSGLKGPYQEVYPEPTKEINKGRRDPGKRGRAAESIRSFGVRPLPQRASLIAGIRHHGYALTWSFPTVPLALMHKQYELSQPLNLVYAVLDREPQSEVGLAFEWHISMSDLPRPAIRL